MQKKISNTLSSYYGIQIGPLPEGLLNNKIIIVMMHIIFYTDQYKMIDDYKNNNYNNAVNKNVPYYNYYQYLPNHSKTNYSAANINKYIRDGLGYTLKECLWCYAEYIKNKTLVMFQSYMVWELILFMLKVSMGVMPYCH